MFSNQQLLTLPHHTFNKIPSFGHFFKVQLVQLMEAIFILPALLQCELHVATGKASCHKIASSAVRL